MSRTLFHRRRACLRGPAGSFGLYLQQYGTYLADLGYVAEVQHEYVHVVEHFGRWLGRRPLSHSTVRQFLGRHLPGCRCQGPRSVDRNRAALNRLLTMAAIPATPPHLPRGFVGDLLGRYEQRLAMVQGLAPPTVHYRLFLARAMLTRLQVRHARAFRAWTPETIGRYVCREGRRYQPSTGQNSACATRCFLRFLLQEELIRRDLSDAVPMFAHWRLASLPQGLREEELARLIKVAEVRSPVGRRDRAVLLCMSELGLRASDVAGLELNGVDLTAGVIRVRRCKEQKSTVLPMTGRLADALRAYLRHGRPACTSQSVFVLHRAPIGKPLTRPGIRNVVLRLAVRAGLGHRIGGTHVLRRSVACRMLGAGASLKQIADLLGHQSIDTTTIYAKVDLNALSCVALPWPQTKEVNP